MRARTTTAARVLAVAIAAQVAAATASVPHLRETQDARSSVRGSTAPQLDSREDAVRALLDARAAAVRARDESAFLAGIDPRATTLRTRQAAVFRALAEVPVATWEYSLDPARERPRDPELDRRFGPGWWAPQVDLSVGLQGVDTRPARLPQHLVFVPRDGRWLLAADDAFAGLGDDSARGIWDFGPVRAVRGKRALVLGHPGDEALLRQVADLTDRAVPRVDAAWRRPWSRRVLVLVPRTQAELGRLVDTPVDLTRIAAVAAAELRREGGRVEPVGERVVVNPGPFRSLGPLGRRVVLTHEVAHVATRAETGPAAPAWLVEGFADWVAYADVRVPLSVSARALRQAVRAGGPPRDLPRDGDFDGGDAGISAVYEASWLAVSRIAERHGADRMRAFYLAVGAATGPSEAAVDSAFRRVLGTTREAFVRDWRAVLQERLG